MRSLNVNMASINGRGRTTFRQERLSSSRIRLTIQDIYCGVENILEDFDYRYDSHDVQEYVASIVDMYLNEADRGLGRAGVDTHAAHALFLDMAESKSGKGLTRIHNERAVEFILRELNYSLDPWDVVRVYDYAIYGTQLALDCLRRMKVKAVA